MEDRFAFLDAYCHYSSSQEELFKTSLLAREEISPESSPPSPSSSAAAFEGNGIIICSAPETPASETAVSPSGDEFKTPPEESRRSSSEEAPPPPKTLSPPRTLSPPHGGEFAGPELDGGQRMSAVETDCGASDGGTLDLGFSEEGNRTPKMVEILSDGRVRVGEVSKLDLESFRVGEKRERPVEEPSPSPSKRIRVSDDCPVLVNTSNVKCPIENGVSDDCLVLVNTPNLKCPIENGVSDDCPVLVNTPNLKCPIANGVNVDTAVDKQVIDVEVDTQVNDVEVDTQVNDVDSGNGKADQIIDTDVIESCEDGKEDCTNNGGISNVEQVHEEEDREEEEGMENGNGGKETVVDGAEDLSKQGRRCLPQSWGCRNGGNREAENRPKTERGSSGNGVGVVLEVLRWLAREEREKRRDQGGPVDFLETAKRRGVKFPDSKLWHGQ